ncbi:MAG TPA: FixH family protein [Dongiaceae bacterium]|nr:FixH family protein [Dongiaceae bacterium]
MESVPGDNAVLSAVPAEVLLRFDEPVTPGRVEVLNSRGESVTADERPVSKDNEVHLALPKALSQGTYLLTYRVTSLDSHPVGGTIVFSIGKPSQGGIAALEAKVSERGSIWGLLATAARLLLFISLVGAAGGTLFHTLVAHDLWRLDDPTRHRLVALTLLGLVAAILGIGIEGAALKGTRLANIDGLLSASLWRMGERTSLGFSLTVAAVALLLLLLALARTRGKLSLLALPAAFAALASLALTGHAVTAGPLWLTVPVLAIHVLVAAFWLGSLWPLWQAVAERPSEGALALLRRFSAIAMPAVLLLIAAGATLACLQLGRLGELFTTDYGLRLASKIAFVLVLLLFAALNRFWLTPALAARHGQAAHRLRISIGLEIVLAMAILAATSSLGEVPPPRALILEAEAQAANAHAGKGDSMAGMDMGGATMPASPGFSVVTFAAGGQGAEIELSPAVAGTNSITIHLFDAAEKPLAAQKVTIELSQPAAGVEPMEHELTAESPGLCRWANAPMPLAGNWKIQLLVLVSDFEEIRFETLAPLR